MATKPPVSVVTVDAGIGPLQLPPMGPGSIATRRIASMMQSVKSVFLSELDTMKKSLFGCVALLFTLSTIGCQPAPMESTDDSTMMMEAPADSNVTATAETPAMTETPVVEEVVTEEVVAEAPADKPAE